MQIIAHRRNTIEQLIETPTELGVEVDIRSYRDRLVIHHDPFQTGVDFEDWLAHFHHRTLVLNTKEEGLEGPLLALMRRHGIRDFFFLDQSFPFLVKTALAGESRCALRVSEFETIDTAMSLAGKVDWIWVDCFTRFPLDRGSTRQLRRGGFKLCLVSPELQQRDPEQEIPVFRDRLDDIGLSPEAVCTKRAELWS